MQLGLNTLIRNVDGQDEWVDLEVMIDLAIELGLDLIDIQLDRGIRSLDDGYLKTVRDRCSDCGIDIGYAGVGQGFVGTAEQGHLRVGAPLSPDDMALRISEVERGIDAAVALGTPLVRLFAGAIPESSPDRSRIHEEMIQAFQRVATYGANRGVRVGLHNHPPAVAPTGRDILGLIEDIDHENITVIMDTGQWHGSIGTNRLGIADLHVNEYAFMEQVMPHTTYVRAKIYRIDTGVEEWLDYDRIFSIFRSADYEGPVSIVFEDRGNTCDYREALSKAIAYLRPFVEAN